MEALHPSEVGDAWDENGGEDGQSEVDEGGGGRSDPGVDDGAALLPCRLPLLLLFLLALLSHQTDQPCLLWACGAEG